MDNRPIGFFDSGAGGITTMLHARKYLKNEKFIYYADDANAPFGGKSREEVLKIAENAIAEFAGRDVKAVVLACNTATGIGAGRLREEFHLNIIGTEPAVKTAAAFGGTTAVLLTPLASKTEKFKQLLSLCQDPVTVFPCETLSQEIEKNIFHLEGIARDTVEKYRLDDFKNVVLGCTHYIFLKSAIEKLLPHSRILDGNDGVSRRLKTLVQEAGDDFCEKGKNVVISTAGKEDFYKLIIERFKN